MEKWAAPNQLSWILYVSWEFILWVLSSSYINTITNIFEQGCLLKHCNSQSVSTNLLCVSMGLITFNYGNLMEYYVIMRRNEADMGQSPLPT